MADILPFQQSAAIWRSWPWMAVGVAFVGVSYRIFFIWPGWVLEVSVHRDGRGGSIFEKAGWLSPNIYSCLSLYLSLCPYQESVHAVWREPPLWKRPIDRQRIAAPLGGSASPGPQVNPFHHLSLQETAVTLYYDTDIFCWSALSHELFKEFRQSPFGCIVALQIMEHCHLVVAQWFTFICVDIAKARLSVWSSAISACNTHICHLWRLHEHTAFSLGRKTWSMMINNLPNQSIYSCMRIAFY